MPPTYQNKIFLCLKETRKIGNHIQFLNSHPYFLAQQSAIITMLLFQQSLLRFFCLMLWKH